MISKYFTIKKKKKTETNNFNIRWLNVRILRLIFNVNRERNKKNLNNAELGIGAIPLIL